VVDGNDKGRPIGAKTNGDGVGTGREGSRTIKQREQRTDLYCTRHHPASFRRCSVVDVSVRWRARVGRMNASSTCDSDVTCSNVTQRYCGIPNSPSSLCFRNTSSSNRTLVAARSWIDLFGVRSLDCGVHDVLKWRDVIWDDGGYIQTIARLINFRPIGCEWTFFTVSQITSPVTFSNHNVTTIRRPRAIFSHWY